MYLVLKPLCCSLGVGYESHNSLSIIDYRCIVRCDDTIWTPAGRYPDDFTVTASAEVASFTCRVGANQTLV